MRDLLPAAAEVQGRILSGLLHQFGLQGFQRVSLPAFEYAAVLEQGLGTIEPSSMIRFVEPETGEVVALRPDMTPQVARMVATRLTDAPVPLRLCYRGSVVRRRHERARNEQQVLQAGIELVGAGGLDADLEVISATVDAVQSAGLTDFVLDLGHGALAHTILEQCVPAARPVLLESLSLKDGAELMRRAKKHQVDAQTVELLCGLLKLSGGQEVFEPAEELLAGHAALKHVLELKAIHDALRARGLTQIVVDLAETRTAEYYSGMMFQILAEGPGQAVASGGRYDELYGLFGQSRRAAGAAIQVDDLAWALSHHGEADTKRVLLVSDSSVNSPENVNMLAGLRAAGVIVSAFSGPGALDYARWWRYSHLARTVRETGVAELLEVRGEAGVEVDWSQGTTLSLPQLLEQLNS